MKRLLFLVALCTVAVLSFASMALAQQGSSEDLNCEDFNSREEAQATLDADPSDPNGLDADGNGLACDEVFSIEAQEQTVPPGAEVAPVTPPTGADSPVFQPTEPDVADQTARQGQYQTPPGAEVAPVTPPPGADSPVFQPAEPDVAVLPDTGGPAFLLPLGVLLVGSGALGFAALRRRGGRNPDQDDG